MMFAEQALMGYITALSIWLEGRKDAAALADARRKALSYQRKTAESTTDWIAWDGSKGSLCPVNADLWVEYRTRSGYIGSRVAGWLAWRWGSVEMPIDIVAYRVEGENGADA